MKQAIFDVSGMSCGHCVSHVTQALEKLSGVEVGHVSVGTAEVRYDPARTTPTAIADAIDAAGYQVRARLTPAADRLACRTEPGRKGGCCCG
jgi:copper chaperone CopZ